ncbi:cyanoexosortase A [Spirulina sp. CS-785/01]|uniref:cyanoexosortase A n=1 Tax=Spirulina sp. CS-785/01 TaxID=3021716 RepID=UPI00232E6D8B|nr:cyanoexosortase A [Spirulina sp. CS-785/01]MDB9315927.1 cyanoexosortase A [Spirulina sp. CS-785/01]
MRQNNSARGKLKALDKFWGRAASPLKKRLSSLSPRFWGLGGLAGLLLILTLDLQGKAGLTSFQITTVIFTLALGIRLQRKQFFHQPSPPILQALGGLLILGTLTLSYGNFASLSPYALPLLLGCGWALIAVGIKKLAQYWQEFLLLAILTIPVEYLVHPLNNTLGISQGMAKFSTFLLWYVGFNVSNQNDYIILPSRATWIDPHCTGVATMLWMLQLAILFLALFPTSVFQKILVPTVALGLVVIVNGIRLAFLAFFAAHYQNLFDYWHSDNAQVFSTIPVVLFGWFCYKMIDDG